MKQILLIAAILLINSNANAQTNIFHIQAPIQPTCKIAWEHSLRDLNDNSTTIIGWDISLNGIRTSLTNVTEEATLLLNGNARFFISCPAFVIGNTILVIFAKNEKGFSGPSPEIQIIMDPPISTEPKPATNVIIFGN